jgi:flavin reductase (DIM6/NTAB) family NADH-FMN oxidoreductase RutF
MHTLRTRRTPDGDPSDLRKALGCFVTGVTIVTTCDASGRPRGFTANSFTSVSLDPPIILVCLSRSASSHAAFAAAQSFAVNILSEDQRAISGRFASKLTEKFADIAWQVGDAGNPILCESAAWFECLKHDEVEAGDHLVMFGRVVGFDHSPRPPLGYHAGTYVSFGLARRARGKGR